MNGLIKALVYTNLWISGGALCFTWFFYLLIGAEPDIYVLGFIFFSTLVTYTFQRFLKLAYKEKIQGPRMDWMVVNQKLVKFILFTGTLGTLFFALYLTLSSLLLLGILGAISFLYAYKFNAFSRKTNLRDVPGIKIFLIGTVWATSCAIIPAIELDVFNTKIVLVCFGFLSYIIGITIPFDIRDLDYDEINKKTIPQLVGAPFSKLIAVLLIGLGYWLMKFPEVIEWQLAVGLLLSILLVSATRKTFNELYYSLILDGLLIAVPSSYYLLQSL